MNSRNIIAAVAIAFAGTGAFAAEYTNFDVPAGSPLSRAEVQAQAISKVLGREVRYIGEAAVIDLPATGARERSEIASKVLGRTVIFNEATTFIDTTSADARVAQVLGRRVQ